MNKNTYITFIVVAFSLSMGIFSHDIILGSTILASGILCSYFAGEAKRIHYALGFVNYLLCGYIAYKNNLYGMFSFYFLLCAPLQIHGLISWKKKSKKDGTVKPRKFTLKNSIIIISSCTLFSLTMTYLLSLIPNQQLASLDAFSNCINICGIILMNMRFKDGIWLWLINNGLDLAIWTIILIRGGESNIMMFLVALAYFLLTIRGIIKWNKMTKKIKAE